MVSRAALVLAVVGAVSTAVPADARPGRTLTAPYQASSIVVVGPEGAYGERCGRSCISFQVLRGERQADITLTDASGRAVGWIASNEQRVARTGCGTGRVPLARGGVWYVRAAVVSSCDAAPTLGELRVRTSG